mgnify:FL=1|jgi:signal peptidase II
MKIKKYFPLIIISSLLFFLDRITKWFVLKNIQDKIVTVFSGLQFNLVWNRGVSWGMFGKTSQLGFYILTAIIIFVVVIFILHTVFEFRNGTNIFFESIVLSGALSNIIDRIMYGGVIDYIDFYIGTWHWPTFNVADACIIIGILGIVGRSIYCAYFRKRKQNLL